MTYLVDLSALLLSSGSSIWVTWAIADRTGEVVNYAKIAENPLLSRRRHAAPATFLFISVWSANKMLQIDGNPQLMGRNAISMPWRKLMWQRNLTVFSVLFSGSADWFTVWLPCLAREEKKRQVFEIQQGSSKDLLSITPTCNWSASRLLASATAASSCMSCEVRGLVVTWWSVCSHYSALFAISSHSANSRHISPNRIPSLVKCPVNPYNAVIALYKRCFFFNL